MSGRCPHALFLRLVGEIIAGIRIHREDKVLVHLCIFDGAKPGVVRLIVGDDEKKIIVLVFLKKLKSVIGDAMAIAIIGGP